MEAQLIKMCATIVWLEVALIQIILKLTFLGALNVVTLYILPHHPFKYGAMGKVVGASIVRSKPMATTQTPFVSLWPLINLLNKPTTSDGVE
jgi:hypothetical protein